MLTQLTIRNYAIVESLELELHKGMTVVSGETGAGKSIMLDALSLALGDRADSGSVRHGAERAEIIATFDIRALPDANQWLHEHDLDMDGECIIRRVITREGRSRSYINGQPCPLNSLKELGEHLIAIHGQHEHQRLLKKEHHRALLDQFAQCETQATAVSQHFSAWQKSARKLHERIHQNQDTVARIQLLEYQINELDQLSVQTGETEALETEQQELEQASQILSSGHQILAMTAEGSEEGEACAAILNHAIHLLKDLNSRANAIQQVSELLSSAQIQIEEASQELRHYLDRVEVNPERLSEVEERLSSIYDTARKHRLQPDELPALQAQLQAELDTLQGSDESIEALEQKTAQLHEQFQIAAQALTAERAAAAKRLNTAVNTQLAELGMASAEFCATLISTEKPQAFGLEEIEFLIATNTGQPARPLARIASGGELSRISLAIQVVTAQSSTTPTLIFDEVDVGIGGAIAEVVGKMLSTLGKRAQILCVTHQPQVASQGDQHLFVSKCSDGDNTHTKITSLKAASRITEIARMLGGIDVTQRSLDHAKEMLGMS